MAIKPSSSKAKWRQAKPERNTTGKHLKPLNKYRQAKSLSDYFEQRVIKHSGYYDSDCWQFRTAGDKDGYPQVIGSKHCKELGLTRAHQVSYYLHYGPINEGKIVCHKCDNPWCVNPEHLFLGSPKENVQDMLNKNRYVHPTELGKGYKLSKEDRDNILALKGLLPCTVVGPMFNTTFSNVARMWRKYVTTIG